MRIFYPPFVCNFAGLILFFSLPVFYHIVAPASYVFVCAILVNINLFFQSTASGFKWAIWMNDAGGINVFTEPRLWSEIIILYSFTSIFALLFDLCSTIYNPFGPRVFDIQVGIRFIIELEQFLSCCLISHYHICCTI